MFTISWKNFSEPFMLRGLVAAISKKDGQPIFATHLKYDTESGKSVYYHASAADIETLNEELSVACSELAV